VDAGPHDVQHDLGPISPELALVDPVLAERARELLPDRPEQPQRVRYPVPVEGPKVTVETPPPPRTRRRGKVLALAAVAFVAGAVSANFLHTKKAASPGVTFQSPAEGQARAQAQAPAGRAAPAPRRAVRKARRTAPAPAKARRAHAAKARRAPAKARRAPAARAWATNVLGVTARVGNPAVTIAWQRPKDSSRVVVVRTTTARRHGVVVFRGRAAAYHDASPRRCTAYRYTIVNYDRRGRPSTGVPTSVVTDGCT
jgi:hypothetical protein